MLLSPMTFSTMPLPSRIKALLTLWFVGETLVFILVVHVIGIGGAILLGLATSLLGLSLLKRAGASAMQTMRGHLGRGGGLPQGRVHEGALLDDTLATFGAIALLLPGFLSDIAGLALAVPPIRATLAGSIARRGGLRAPKPGTDRPRHGPGVIDLDPQDWRHDDWRHDDWRNSDPTQQAMPKG